MKSFVAVVVAVILVVSAFILGHSLETSDVSNPNNDQSSSEVEQLNGTRPGTHARRFIPSIQSFSSDEPQRTPVIYFDASMSVTDYLEALEDLGMVNQQEANYVRHSWLETCVEVLKLTGSSTKYGGRYDPGPKADILYQLGERCEEFLPDSVEISNGKISDHMDVLALRELINELTPENSYHEKGTLLEETFASGGVDALTRDALEILTGAMDEASIITALKHLTGRGVLDPSPTFGNYRNAGQSVYFHDITNDVALVLLCERTGGCWGSNHPVVLRRCFQHHFGCMGAVDIHDAIYQTTAPVQYEIFWTLLTETRRLMAKYRR